MNYKHTFYGIKQDIYEATETNRGAVIDNASDALLAIDGINTGIKLTADDINNKSSNVPDGSGWLDALSHLLAILSVDRTVLGDMDVCLMVVNCKFNNNPVTGTVTKAYELASDLSDKLGDMAVLVGTNAYFNSKYSTDMDTDIAVHWDTFIKLYCRDGGIGSVLSAVRQAYPSHSDSSRTVTYNTDVAVSVCEYVANSNTLWDGVESLKFPDGSKLDILWYSDTEHLVSISSAMESMLNIPKIFEKDNKEQRIRWFEHLVKMFYTLK